MTEVSRRSCRMGALAHGMQNLAMEAPMRHFTRWLTWIVPIAIAVATPACTCGGNVGPVHAGASANVSN